MRADTRKRNKQIELYKALDGYVFYRMRNRVLKSPWIFKKNIKTTFNPAEVEFQRQYEYMLSRTSLKTWFFADLEYRLLMSVLGIVLICVIVLFILQINATTF
jgi:hypothetical protein